MKFIVRIQNELEKVNKEAEILGIYNTEPEANKAIIKYVESLNNEDEVYGQYYRYLSLSDNTWTVDYGSHYHFLSVERVIN